MASQIFLLVEKSVLAGENAMILVAIIVASIIVVLPVAMILASNVSSVAATASAREDAADVPAARAVAAP